MLIASLNRSKDIVTRWLLVYVLSLYNIIHQKHRINLYISIYSKGTKRCSLPFRILLQTPNGLHHYVLKVKLEIHALDIFEIHKRSTNQAKFLFYIEFKCTSHLTSHYIKRNGKCLIVHYIRP